MNISPGLFEPQSTATDIASTSEHWRGFPVAAGRLACVSGALLGIVLAIAALATFGWRWLGRPDAMSLFKAVSIIVLLLIASGWLSAKMAMLRWRSCSWRLDNTGLHVRSGRFWRREVLIPRSRVQHLDIERGPIERHFGLATLVVHTAGTRLHALRQSGFSEADAVALRDALVPASGLGDDVV